MTTNLNIIILVIHTAQKTARSDHIKKQKQDVTKQSNIIKLKIHRQLLEMEIFEIFHKGSAKSGHCMKLVCFIPILMIPFVSQGPSESHKKENEYTEQCINNPSRSGKGFL